MPKLPFLPTRARLRPGAWYETAVVCPISRAIRAQHVLPIREYEADLHVLDIGGSCPCRPTDTHQPLNYHAVPCWHHQELTRLQ